MNSPSPENSWSASRARSHAKNSIDIQQRLAAYKSALPLEVAYYARVVREAPARAIDMLLYKDMIREEAGMLLVEQVMPDLTKVYTTLDQEAKSRIDERVRQARSYQKGKIFANEVLREVGRVSRRRHSRA